MAKETILIVDDEEEIVSFIKDALEDEGYEILTAFDGERAIKEAAKKPDIVLLDVMMDGLDGFEVCEQIRSVVRGPIIFLSACQDETNRVKGLVVGGDDYIVKPFSLSELKARVHAHLRRERRKIEEKEKTELQFGAMTIDYKGRSVRLNGIDVELTSKQFSIVWFLSLHRGQVFSRSHIYERVWGLDADGDDTTVTEHIKKIRAKFQEIDPTAAFIQTVWGVGYKWG
ncbi:chemotaxis protein [Bacillus sp. OxB-1]|uniref:response regulator transcription factor n=1 Tax=Bacillus sp. (strain OxB-1) TaxID=98228 RepID=UPI000581E425|nr:response regulator transcription factor [Bacillus sp. OxB-1]BAQ08604.1 chemotaxis protein [Bacillus sp. OxB-1]